MSGLLSPAAALREISDLGLAVSGAKLHTYVSGTPATNLASYSDAALTIPNTNPIVASAGGLFGPIYLTKGVAYKFVLTDASDVTIWTRDPVLVPNAPTLAAGTGIALVVAGDTTTISVSPPNVPSVSVNDFRLTLESGVPASSTDQTAKATLYCTPAGGNQIDLYDAAGVPTRITSAEFSIAVPAVASQLYDVFVYNNAGVATLELVAWTNDTTPAVALVRTTVGAQTKSGDLTRRFLGLMRTTTVAGQTEDSNTKRYVWNDSNQRPRPLQRFETAATWTYATPTTHQANANVANQVETVTRAGAVIDLSLHVGINNSVGTVSAGIGENSLTTYAAGSNTFPNSSGAFLGCRLTKPPAIGRNVYSWNENATGSGTITFSGAAASTGNAGLDGVVWG